MTEMAREWQDAIRRWERQDTVVLFDEVQRLLTAGVCRWAGIPLAPSEIASRARDLASIIDSFAGVGPRLWKGKLARVRSEGWIGKLIHDVRRGALQVPDGSVLSVMAQHRDESGAPLGPRVAAVEVLNVIRPTVAIAWYVTFAALALHQYPDAREKVAREASSNDAGEYTDLFMQEVRRFYPFTPFLGAKVRESFAWRGHTFKKGILVLLDVHGTNHDPRLWDAPEEFRPERFRTWSGDAFDFIPQGGGDRRTGHRCPGEWITMHNVALALHFLTRCASYEVVPDQDLSFSRRRMPTRPESGFILRNVRAHDALDARAPHLPSITAARDAAVSEGRSEAGISSAVPHL